MQQSLISIIISILIILLLLWAYFRLRLKKLAVYNSPLLGKIEIFQQFNGEKFLTINSYPQGISIEQPNVSESYWYCIAKEAIHFCQGRPSPKVLMLGLGANTISSLIAKFNPKIKQTIIEIDSSIIEACQKFFGLDQLPNYQLIQADVYKIIEQKKAFSHQFDVLIVDVFNGHPPYISLESNQPSFIEKLLPWLKSDGMIIFNRPAHKEEVRVEGFALEKYLKTLFKKTKIMDIKDPRGFRNHVIIGKGKLAKY